jgi:CRP-like cAMP-binding protein
MTASHVLSLTESRQRRTVADGQLLIRAAQAHPALYVLESGRLVIELGGRRINTVDEPGSVLGELGMLLDIPATADVRADGDVVVREIDDAEQLFDDVPQFARFVATTLARRLHQITGYLEDLQEQFAEQPGTLGLVPQVLEDLLSDAGDPVDPGSERERDSPY